MRPAAQLLGGALLVLSASGAAAQFEDTQVSGPGAPPFLLSKAMSQHEDLAAVHPDVTYNVYRWRPGEAGFHCIDSNRSQVDGWDRDPASPPAGEVWWYTIDADDTWGENQHGNARPIVERCPCSGPAPVSGTPDLGLELVTTLNDPLYLDSPPGDRDRVFIVEQDGYLRIVKRGRLLTDPFLDFSAKVFWGALSMAFHPDYPQDGRFYVVYSETPSRDTVVEEYRVSADPDRADPASGRIVFRQNNPSGLHNGGQIAFSPADGYLYIGMGDGGPPEDPFQRAQDLSNRFGALSRIDIDNGVPFAIPPDNPFVGNPAALDEIWVYGLRMPWRFSFDRVTGELYIGDAGEYCFEEVTVIPPGVGGDNLGWNLLEGDRCFGGAAASDCPAKPPCAQCPAINDCAEYRMPALVYDQGTSCTAVIGGYVYRGCRWPDLAGTYFYAEYCQSWTGSFVHAAGVATQEILWPGLATAEPVSFGQDGRGNLYLLNRAGEVFRIVAD